MIILSVEKAVEPPKQRVTYKYPHAEMEVGDSFVVPVDHKVLVRNANFRASKRLGFVFRSLTQGDVVRVWRVS